MRFKRTIATAIFGVLLALLYFTSDFALIDIEKTAIVVAIGIDKDENGYSVTAQIGVPEGSESSSKKDDAVMTGTGKTVLEAIDNVGAETGWHPKLSFCSMIFIGKDVATDDVETIIDFFVTSERVDNSATIAMTDGKASELLTAKTPLDSITSFALQKIVLKSEWMVSTVGATNLKSFAVMTNSRSKSAYMPVIDIIKGKVESSGENAQSGGEGKSQSGGGEKKDEEVLFDSSSVGLFYNGSYVGRLSDEETLLYYMLIGPVYQCFIGVGDNNEQYFLTIESNERTIDVDVLSATVYLKLKLKVSLADSTEGIDLTSVVKKTVVDRKVLRALENKLDEIAASLSGKIVDTKADIFMIKERIYKYHNSDYERLKDLSIDKFTFKTENIVVSAD